MDRKDVISPETALRYFLETEKDLFRDAYAVVGTYDLFVRDHLIRIETRRRLPTGTYDVRVYQEKDDIWEEWSNFANCDRPSETEVLMQAQSFIWDALRPK